MLPAILAALGEASGSALAGARAAGTLGLNPAGQNITGQVGVAAMQGQQIATLGQSAHGLIGSIKGLLNPFDHLEKSANKLYERLNLFPSKILEVEAMITSTAHNWVAALAAPANTIKQLGDSVSGFVRLSNPALVKQFEFRIENTFSDIGRTLEPILQSLTIAAQKAGDAYARAKPAIDPAIRAVTVVIDYMADQFTPAMRTAAPAIKLASEALLTFVGALKLFGPSIEMITAAFGPILQWASILGISFDSEAKGGSAVRPARYTSTEEYQRELAKNSLEASIGVQKPKSTESWLEQIYNLLAEWFGIAQEAAGFKEGATSGAGGNPDTDTGARQGLETGMWRVIS